MLVPPSWRIAWRTARAVVHAGRRGAATAAATAAATTPLAPLLLRDYQEECIQSVLASLKRGQKRLGISLATGSGKTVIFTQLVDRIPPSASGANRTLILAHRRELVEQAARHCTRTYPDKTIGIEMGSLHASGADDITVASVQSVLSGERIHKFDPRQFKLVLVDEAHHIVARGYMQILEHFGLDRKVEIEAGKPLPADPRPALVGVSATFARFDGLALGAAIDEIVYHKDYVEMIGDGWLTDVIFTTVQSTVDLSQVRSDTGKDFRLNELSRAVNTPQANEVTVRTWLAKATVAGGAPRPRHSTLVFCVDLNHVADLTATFRKFGVEAYYITSETDKVERGERLEAFKRGDFPVLLNCGVFTEGTDMPNVDCVLLARPTKSRNLLIQMIGRGMRLHAGKANCHVIDMVSSLAAGVVTTPTLFGLDPREIVDDASVEDLEALRNRRLDEPIALHKPTPVNAPITKVRFTEYSSVLDLISDTSSERHIRGLSKNAWVQVAPERYVLCGPTGTYLRIEETDDADQADQDGCRFRVVELRALPRSISKAPFAPPRQISRAETLTDAVHAADFYASKIFPHPFITRFIPWRKNPASQGQLDFINKIRKDKEDPLTPDDITRGEAADMITKIKHGARGQFQVHQANRRRADREMAVRERERKRERVTVGPLPS